MGFCYINNIAVVAAAAKAAHGLSRVAIVDWDVHHGACLLLGFLPGFLLGRKRKRALVLRVEVLTLGSSGGPPPRGELRWA
eukprot:350758-Chlamydomonas_euryale.AAC.12